MKLIRKCGLLIMHAQVKSRRSGNTHNYWVAYNGTCFNLNWCNGYKQGTHKTFSTLKDAVNHFDKFIKE